MKKRKEPVGFNPYYNEYQKHLDLMKRISIWLHPEHYLKGLKEEDKTLFKSRNPKPTVGELAKELAFVETLMNGNKIFPKKD